MIRKIIRIDKDLCSGCGLCVSACHEGAIGIVNGKAELLRDDYCDGLGNCLPTCPTGAITFEEREADPYNKTAIKTNGKSGAPEQLSCGCLGSHTKSIIHEPCNVEPRQSTFSKLNQWPVQIKLIAVNAAYFNNANLLIAADCTAYAYGNFHNDFMKNKITLIGCPKLDDGNYAEKLSAILRQNNIKSVTIIRMEVPCCGGLESAVKTALIDCGKLIPWHVTVISTNGKILDE
ncbi:MAG: 4Fe-4S binding protein [Clostridia bacterium]